MKFLLQKRVDENVYRYNNDDIRLAKVFTDRSKEEFGEFLKAVILFGSVAKNTTTTEKSDIDLLILVDDLTFNFSEELIESYKIIVERLIADISFKLHITSMTITSFWEYVKAGDPVAINILRDGHSLYDQGFFDPLQALLKRGRIRPSEESIWNYYGRAPRTLTNSHWHILQATLDLYWAVIDSAHAALMRAGEVPPSPEHVADFMEKVLVPKGLDKKYVSMMREFYDLSKSIVYREIKLVHGKEYDSYQTKASDFVNRMRVMIDQLE